jgi:hypothetical protein
MANQCLRIKSILAWEVLQELRPQGTVSFGNLLLYSRFFSSAENHENRLCFFTQPLFMPRFRITLCPQTEQFREQNNCNNFRICSKVDKV